MSLILWQEKTRSTNDDAKAYARSLLETPVWIAADTQTQGRGRGDRQWESPKGNLYASYLERWDEHYPNMAQISFVAALAVIDAVKFFLDDSLHKELSCKWPNDVLFQSQKFCGILLERLHYNGGLWLICGIGVNLKQAPQAQTLFPATDLGLNISPRDFLTCLDSHFEKRLSLWKEFGFQPIRDLWSSLAAFIGQTIHVNLPKEQVKGQCIGLDEMGRLKLQIANGTYRLIEAGDVFFSDERIVIKQ